jgi:predicted nucleic acid-binding protein
LSNLRVVDIDAPMVVRAIDIGQRWKISYWDGLIVAAAERAGCNVLCSEDFSGGQRYGRVTVRNPFPRQKGRPASTLTSARNG